MNNPYVERQGYGNSRISAGEKSGSMLEDQSEANSLIRL